MESLIALTKFEAILPELSLPQDALLARMAALHARAASAANEALTETQILKLINRYGASSSKIHTRFFESLDIPGSDLDMFGRMLFFKERADTVFSKFYQSVAIPPSHIIHVSCTGYVSPSPPQTLLNTREWLEGTCVTHAYHMGCYAALTACRMAEGFMAALQKKKQLLPLVDIVHTEMCGLHMNPYHHDPVQLVVQSLFADGHMKYSALPTDQAENGFEVLTIREQIIKDSGEDMTWILSNRGMKMTLSREVPDKIGQILSGFLENLLSDIQYQISDVINQAYFAIHPGGPKIIDAVQSFLKLSEEQVAASRTILQQRGNMSSATLPHVWQLLLNQNIRAGSIVISLAFGPGLTIFGAVFKVI